jgi:hypothetical protein
MFFALGWFIGTTLIAGGMNVALPSSQWRGNVVSIVAQGGIDKTSVRRNPCKCSIMKEGFERTPGSGECVFFVPRVLEPKEQGAIRGKGQRAQH